MSEHTPGPWEYEWANNRWVFKGDLIICQIPRTGKPCHEANARLIKAAPDLLLMLQTLVGHVDDLIAHSVGVAGLHKNGSIASWEELTRGGRFEEWLAPLETAREAIRKATQAHPTPNPERS